MISNKIIQKKGYVEVICNYRNKEYKVLIDNEDISLFGIFDGKLLISKTAYKLYSYIKQSNVKLLAHRHILDAKDEQLVTFLDGNSLNLRRANLCFASRSQIGRHKRLQRNNESGCPGVTWNDKHSKWIARVYKNGKAIYLGSYANKSEAIRARRKAEKEYYSED